MKRKVTRRERWFLTFTPAALILSVFVFGVYRPVRAAMAEARRRVAVAEKERPSEAVIAAKGRIVRDLEQRVAATKQERSFEPTSLPPLDIRADADEPLAVARVNEALRSNHVVVVDCARLPDHEGREIPPAEVLTALDSIAKGAARGFWRLSVVGGYGGVRDSLKEIEAMDEWVLPLKIVMDPAPAGADLHRWSLWFWM